MKPVSRRTLLRGAGAALALPSLEAMLPTKSRAAEAVKAPVRMALYITGGGAYVPFWSLNDSGRRDELGREKAVVYQAPAEERNEPLGQLSPSLEPLEAHKKDLLVLGGLSLIDTHQFEDGHSAEIAALLTCAPLMRDQVQCGVSVDQFAARQLEGKCYLDSLVLGLNGSRPGGAKGIGRVYAQHYSWRSATTPTGEERNPKAAFDRLFRGMDGTASGRATRKTALADSDRKSVLDLVREEANRLKTSLGVADQQKLDEYLTAVRDVERRIEFSVRKPAAPDAPSLLGDPNFPVQVRVPGGTGIPESYVDYDRLMVDIIALAFATDRTRVAVLTHGGYRSYPEVEVKRGHHDLQHHEGDPEKRDDLRKVDRFNMGLYAHMLERFKSIREGSGTLLDNSMVMFASGMSNGNRHARENLPVLLAGRAGGTLKPGRHLDYNWKRLTPLANLYVEMLQRLGCPAAQFGNSTGGLPHLT
jgi:hypothetical protein